MAAKLSLLRRAKIKEKPRPCALCGIYLMEGAVSKVDNATKLCGSCANREREVVNNELALKKLWEDSPYYRSRNPIFLSIRKILFAPFIILKKMARKNFVRTYRFRVHLARIATAGREDTKKTRCGKIVNRNAIFTFSTFQKNQGLHCQKCLQSLRPDERNKINESLRN